MQGKRVFVSGGAGVIGTALVNQLLQEGADVFVGDLKPCPLEWIGRLQYRQGDLNTITQEELLTFDPHVFFHLAATFERSEESYPFLEENFHHNVQLSHHLLQCLKEASHLERIVFASSYLIYDPHLYQFKNSHRVVSLKEQDTVYPRNICGAAKHVHELELRFITHFKPTLSCVSARIFRVYGRQSRDIISRWIRAALRDETLTVYRPEGQFDYIFADDVADGLIRLAKAGAQGVVNLGSGRARSVHEVLNILKSYFPNLKTQEVSCQIPFEASQADITQLEQWTEWKPPHLLEQAIPLLITFERQALQVSEIPKAQAVLITSISKKLPLLEAVKTATRKLGHFLTIHGSDSDEKCIGQYGVDAFWHSPRLDSLTIEEVIKYCRQHGIEAIIPTRDADLPFYALHRDLLNRQGIHVLVSSPEAVSSCLDKKLFADTLIQKGFPVIPTSCFQQDFNEKAYVVKERYGAGSQHVGLNLSKQEAQEHSRHLHDPIIQPYRQGQEWSIDVYRSWEGEIIGSVARRRDLVVGGESQVTTTVSYPALQQLCEKITDFLDLYGHAVFQVIEDAERQFHVVECNPRFGGASTASLAVGLDSFYWFLLESLGQKVQQHDFIRCQKEIRQIRYPTDRIMPWSSSST